jgi:nitrate/TMAO reductase-like tetraheme cytochrome c subunit
MPASEGPPSKSGRRTLIVLTLLFVAGIAFAGLFSAGLADTNDMDFCVSCHTMQTNYKEYQQSLHYKNQSGVQATCADCHVPKPLLPKMITKLVAAKDVWHQIIGTIDTPEKFEARRWEMASRVEEDARQRLAGMPQLPRRRQYGSVGTGSLGAQPSRQGRGEGSNLYRLPCRRSAS